MSIQGCKHGPLRDGESCEECLAEGKLSQNITSNRSKTLRELEDQVRELLARKKPEADSYREILLHVASLCPSDEIHDGVSTVINFSLIPGSLKNRIDALKDAVRVIPPGCWVCGGECNGSTPDGKPMQGCPMLIIERAFKAMW